MNLPAWQRASLPMLILKVLAVAPRHGYAISQALVAAGLQPIKGAQLYPALVRLEDEGAIVAQWEQGASGPARKVYELTPAGSQQLEDLGLQWEIFQRAVETLGSEPATIRSAK
jgi:PadR family transcriptional regulator, regulatory protein PadR